MDFSAFDTSKIDEYSKKAKEQWGETKEYKEYETKMAKRSKEDEQKIMSDFMDIFKEFGTINKQDPSSADAQTLVKKLQNYISEHFYNCSKEVLAGLGAMYASGNEFTTNIDHAGGEGTADFVSKAINIFTKK